MTKGKTTQYIHGYHFGLNSDTASLIAQDKHATGSILKKAGICTLEQIFFLRLNQQPYLVSSDILSQIPDFTFPLICKPNLGGGGHDVTLVNTPEELERAVAFIHEKDRGVLVSEFQEIETEYRIILLKEEVLLVYGKKSPENDIRHNLSNGAHPILTISDELRITLTKIAQVAMSAIGLDFGAVDIIEVEKRGVEGFEYKVLEINSGVCLEYFSEINNECKEKAEDIYKKVFDVLFKN